MVTAAQSDTKRRGHKRADGEGYLRYSDTKKLWIGRLMVGYRLDGKPDIREVAAKTQKVCKAKLDALKAQAAGGTLPSTDLAGLTVGAFLDRWLATVRPNLRERTYRRYEQYVRVHFKPALGTKRLAKMSHDDVQAFLNAKRDERVARGKGKAATALAPRTLHHVYVVLGTALTWAVKKGYVAVSPMVRVDPPRAETAEIVPLTPEQTTALLDAAEAHADPLLGLWTLAALTGARKSELLGLTWNDVDLEAGTLCIRPSTARKLKTRRSRRMLDLDPDAVAALTAHRDRQAFARQALGEGYADPSLVFASDLGTPLDPDNVTKRFKRALKRAGLPQTTRLHDLRHGVATMLLEAGEPVPSVSEYLGHASPAITMTIYAHAVPGASKRAAERLGSILRGARTAPDMPAEGAIAAG